MSPFCLNPHPLISNGMIQYKVSLWQHVLKSLSLPFGNGSWLVWWHVKAFSHYAQFHRRNINKSVINIILQYNMTLIDVRIWYHYEEMCCVVIDWLLYYIYINLITESYNAWKINKYLIFNVRIQSVIH